MTVIKDNSFSLFLAQLTVTRLGSSGNLFLVLLGYSTLPIGVFFTTVVWENKESVGKLLASLRFIAYCIFIPQ